MKKVDTIECAKENKSHLRVEIFTRYRDLKLENWNISSPVKLKSIRKQLKLQAGSLQCLKHWKILWKIHFWWLSLVGRQSVRNAHPLPFSNTILSSERIRVPFLPPFHTNGRENLKSSDITLNSFSSLLQISPWFFGTPWLRFPFERSYPGKSFEWCWKCWKKASILKSLAWKYVFAIQAERLSFWYSCIAPEIIWPFVDGWPAWNTNCPPLKNIYICTWCKAKKSTKNCAEICFK